MLCECLCCWPYHCLLRWLLAGTIFPLTVFKKLKAFFFFCLLLMQYNCLKSATVLVGQDVISIRDAIGKKNTRILGATALLCCLRLTILSAWSTENWIAVEENNETSGIVLEMISFSFFPHLAVSRQECPLNVQREFRITHYYACYWKQSCGLYAL